MPSYGELVITLFVSLGPYYITSPRYHHMIMVRRLLLDATLLEW
jgi:hypothetical protein